MNYWGGLGVVYGNNWETVLYNGPSPFPTAEVSTELDEIYAGGVRRLRIILPTFTYTEENSWIDWCHACITLALSKGFYVVWGVVGGAVTLTAANWDTFATAVKTQAAACQILGLSEFQIGNELEADIDNTTITESPLRYNLSTLGSEVQCIFTTRHVSCSVSGRQPQVDWIADANKGDLDSLALNDYGLYVNSVQFEVNLSAFNAVYGGNFYLSELNLSAISSDYINGETWEAGQIFDRIKIIKKYGIKSAYFFTWRWDSTNFAIKKSDGSTKQWWKMFTGHQRKGFFII